MALIGKIRKNSWLLVVVIGLALAAFVIMDMTGQGGPGGQEMTVVEVEGEKVSWNEFQQAERILCRKRLRQMVWQYPGKSSWICNLAIISAN